MDNLIIASRDRQARDTRIATLLDHTHPTGYIDVMGGGRHPADHTAYRDDMDGALAVLAANPRLLILEDAGQWLRGGDWAMPNPDNNPRIAAWNESMRRSNLKRIDFRNRLRGLMEGDQPPALILTCPDATALLDALGRWPIGVPSTSFAVEAIPGHPRRRA